MTYIPDGASKDYHKGEDSKFYAWGWLSSEHNFNSGWKDDERKERFLKAVKDLQVVDKYMGWHKDEGLGLNRFTEPYPNGSRKFEHNGTVYTAPAAVTYYIKELDYKPPMKVIDALI